MKSLLLTLALFASRAQSPQQFGQPEQLVVAARADADGREFCTIHAVQVPVDRVLTTLAQELGQLPGHGTVAIEGFTPPLRAALVTVRVDDRGIDTALEWMLGSVGLDFRRRPGVISVLPLNADELDVEALETKAMLAYVRATRSFPDHTLAATARMHQGRLEESRGNLSAALSHFEAVQESYRDSHHVPEAVWRRGLVMQRIGSWSEANLAFRTLANLSTDHSWHADARLEMARCAIELEDPIRARHILAALSESHPPTSYEERTDRRLISARAELETGDAMGCLRTLDPILGGKLEPDQRVLVFEMQARSLEALDRPSEAAWAWQVYADAAGEAERVAALENAARLSLEAGEELNVFFLERLATEYGAKDRLEPYALEAATRLGLGSGRVQPGDGDRLETIERAERLLDIDDAPEAARLLEPIFADRDDLTDELALRLFPVWGRCLASLRGIDSAIRMLSRARARFQDVEQRRRIDLSAAALLEQHELYEKAVDAYEGRY